MIYRAIAPTDHIVKCYYDPAASRRNLERSERLPLFHQNARRFPVKNFIPLQSACITDILSAPGNLFSISHTGSFINTAVYPFFRTTFPSAMTHTGNDPRCRGSPLHTTRLAIFPGSTVPSSEPIPRISAFLFVIRPIAS